MNIPDDVMAIAHDLSLTGCGCDEDASHECPNMNGYCRYQETAIARAILSERESATKAERERCAKIAKIHGHHALWPVIGICEYNEISVHDGFGNKLSSRIAAAIRKGDGE